MTLEIVSLSVRFGMGYGSTSLTLSFNPLTLYFLNKGKKMTECNQDFLLTQPLSVLKGFKEFFS